MIGLSISFCIPEIVRGIISLDEVKAIISGTRITDNAGWEDLITQYRKTYWRWSVGSDEAKLDECERIFRALLTENKIHQPRLEGRQIERKPGEFWAESTESVRYTSA